MYLNLFMFLVTHCSHISLFVLYTFLTAMLLIQCVCAFMCLNFLVYFFFLHCVQGVFPLYGFTFFFFYIFSIYYIIFYACHRYFCLNIFFLPTQQSTPCHFSYYNVINTVCLCLCVCEFFWLASFFFPLCSACFSSFFCFTSFFFYIFSLYYIFFCLFSLLGLHIFPFPSNPPPSTFTYHNVITVCFCLCVSEFFLSFLFFYSVIFISSFNFHCAWFLLLLFCDFHLFITTFVPFTFHLRFISFVLCTCIFIIFIRIIILGIVCNLYTVLLVVSHFLCVYIFPSM